MSIAHERAVFRGSPSRMRMGFAALVLVGTLSFVGCNGTGDDDVFSCTIRTSSTSEIHVDQSRGSDSGHCDLELKLGDQGFSDVYGISFHLSYPPGLVIFDGARDTGVLSPDAAPTDFQVAVSGTEIIVGYTRVGPIAGVPLAPQTPLVEVFFRTGETPGAAQLQFTFNELQDSTGLVLSPPPSWADGTIEVVME